jgi:DNA topoisomerase-1
MDEHLTHVAVIFTFGVVWLRFYQASFLALHSSTLLHTWLLQQVVASYGHVRDLANKAGSVKPDEDWSLVWQLTGSGAAKMQELAAASAGCRALLLATDPDREGEAISWHITEELKVSLHVLSVCWIWFERKSKGIHAADECQQMQECAW